MDEKQPKKRTAAKTPEKTVRRAAKTLKPQHQKFANNVVKGMTGTEAYRNAYPKASYDTARINAAKLLTNANISAEIQNRIQQSINHAQTSSDEVLGHAVRQMRSSMADVLNEQGEFDLEKAQGNGAIDFVKKIEIKTIVNPETGDKEITHKVELYSSQDGRRDAANYIGLEKAPTDAGLERVAARIAFAYFLSNEDESKLSGIVSEWATRAQIKEVSELEVRVRDLVREFEFVWKECAAPKAATLEAIHSLATTDYTNIREIHNALSRIAELSKGNET